MSFTDWNSKKTIANQSGQIHQLSLNDIKKSGHLLNYSNKNRSLKSVQTFLLNLMPMNRRLKDNIEIKSLQQQPQQHVLPPGPSIIKSLDIEQPPTKKTVAFASAHDIVPDEQDHYHLDFELRKNIEDDSISEDIVTVISNKHVDDFTINDPKGNVEPYPFRSEIQLYSLSQSNSSNNVFTTKNHSRKKILRFFLPHRHSKKLHPLKVKKTIKAMNRSTSAPDILVSSQQPVPSPMETKRQNQRRGPIKKFRAWLTSLPSRVLTKPFVINSHHNHESKPKAIQRRSIGLRRFSEYLY